MQAGSPLSPLRGEILRNILQQLPAKLVVKRMQLVSREWKELALPIVELAHWDHDIQRLGQSGTMAATLQNFESLYQRLFSLRPSAPVLISRGVNLCSRLMMFLDTPGRQAELKGLLELADVDVPEPVSRDLKKAVIQESFDRVKRRWYDTAPGPASVNPAVLLDTVDCTDMRQLVPCLEVMLSWLELWSGPGVCPVLQHPRFFERLVQAVKAVSEAFDEKQDRPFVAQVCSVFTRLAYPERQPGTDQWPAFKLNKDALVKHLYQAIVQLPVKNQLFLISRLGLKCLNMEYAQHLRRLLTEPAQLGDKLLLKRLDWIRGYIAALPPQGVESVEPVLAQRLCALDDEAQSRVLGEWGHWQAWGPITVLETAVDKARENKMSLPSALRAAFPTMMETDRHD